MSATVLVVCIGVLWGGMCDIHRQFVYPTEAACKFEAKRANARIVDGYAYCTTPEQVPKEAK